jgi:hypothetical protein
VTPAPRAPDANHHLATMTGPDLRQLASLADLRDLQRLNRLEELLRGPTIGAFTEGAPPLPPLLPEQLDSAMAALALRGWSVAGLLRAAEGFSAGRLFPETVDRVVVDLLTRRARGEL